jgi:general secretion pathway protein F
MVILDGRASVSRILHVVVSLDTAVKGGIPIVRSITLTAEGCRDKSMREALFTIADALKRGDTLGGAVKPFQRYLGDEFTAGLSIGDASGKLPEALTALVELYEYRLKMRRAIMKQLIYPICIVFITVVIIPYIRGMVLSELNIMDFTTQYIFGLRYIILYAILCWVCISIIRSIRPLRRGVGYAFSSFWPMGSMLRRFALSRFFDSLSLLLVAGLSNERAMKLALHFAANLRVERTLAPLVESLRKGSTIHVVLGSTRLVPANLVRQIKTAELAGNVEKALHECAMELTSGSRHILELGVSLLEAALILMIGFAMVFGLIPLG